MLAQARLLRTTARVLPRYASTTASQASPALAAWIATAPHVSLVEQDVVSLTRVRSLVSTLETDGLASSWNTGDALPQAWSLILFHPSNVPTSSLRSDGTERTPLHPPGGLERMWVGGTFDFKNELRVGEAVECTSRLSSVKERVGKDGRAGWYVEQERVIRMGGEEAVVERRTHLYRSPLGETPVAPAKMEVVGKREADFGMPFLPTPEMLMRFSALTFNTHRIHWDERYAIGVEGREGLIVHGPLTALLLLNTLRLSLPSSPSPSPSFAPIAPSLSPIAPSSSPVYSFSETSPSARRIKSYSYRATAPLVVGRAIEFKGKWSEGGMECELWVEDHEGRVYMTGKAVVE